MNIAVPQLIPVRGLLDEIAAGDAVGEFVQLSVGDAVGV